MKRALLLGLAGFFACLFLALGVWQVERRDGKLALIAAVEDRIHTAPAPPPPPARWPALSAAKDEYRRLTVRGQLLHDREVLVQALTEAGAGFWVMTPLRTSAGVTILINRGFVPPDRRTPRSRAQALPRNEVRITGLLRMSEPGGGFLRTNQPAADRWYSRDVQAIGARGGLATLAPFFIDADKTPNPGGWPAGGLTVVAFPNNHLIYALTWFGLALLSAGGFVLVWRADKPLPRGGAAGAK